MQAQAVFNDQSLQILGRWSYCQNLNRDSATLLQAQDMVPLTKLTKCRIFSEDLINWDLKC